MAGLFDRIDRILPGASDKILLAAGVGLALAAALGILGVAAPAVAAGFGLIATVLGAIFSPVTAVIAAIALIAAAAYDIYANWDAFAPFFKQMWDGVQRVFGGFIRFLAGVFNFDMTAAYEGLTSMWDGLKAYYFGLFAILIRLFNHFTEWVDSWTGGAMTSAIGGIKRAWDKLEDYFIGLWGRIRAPFDTFVEDFANSPVGRLMGFSSDPAANAPDRPKGQEGLAAGRRETPVVRIEMIPPAGWDALLRRGDRGVDFVPLDPLGLGRAVGIP